ncbi:hypothetical protein [Streptomyces sp. NPDC055243]|uniref:hypothetical protein n=1 Tax=Streptomyces sp. NPDC055243 TaxID=3365720 RepID=UPI0037CF9C4A
MGDVVERAGVSVGACATSRDHAARDVRGLSPTVTVDTHVPSGGLGAPGTT